MDPLSILSAVIEIGDLVQMIINYGIEVKNFKNEQAKVLKQMQGLAILLQQLADRLKGSNEADPWFQGLSKLAKPQANRSYGSDSVFAQLNAACAAIDVEVQPKHGYMRRVWARAIFPLRTKGEINDKLTEVRNLSFLIDQVLHHDDHAVQMATKNEVTVISSRVTAMDEKEEIKERDEERKAIVTWLSPLESAARQDEIFDRDLKTGQWLLNSEEFKHWVMGRPWFLCCWGAPGTGKTVLCSIIVNHLQQRFGGQDVPVLCLYLNDKESKDQTLDNLMGSLLKQVVQHQATSFQSPTVKKLFQKDRTGSRAKASEIVSALQSELKQYKRTYLVVDALDECSGSFRSKFLDILQTMSRQLGNLSLLITLRPWGGELLLQKIGCNNCGRRPLRVYFHCAICDPPDGFDLCQTCSDQKAACKVRTHVLKEPYLQVNMEVRAPPEEIFDYVNREIQIEKSLGTVSGDATDTRVGSQTLGTTRFGRICLQNPKLAASIPRIIQDRANGMFLLAKFYMDDLKAKQNVQQVEDAIQNQPRELDENYKKIMERIEVQRPDDSTLAKQVLLWIVCARRPLSLLELQHALAVDLMDSDFNPKKIVDKDTILSTTAGLVIVDRDEGAVRLAHLTAQEYFDRNRETLTSKPETEIAKIALKYLSFTALSEPCKSSREDEDVNARLQKYPFLRYACEHWGDHAHNAGADEEVQKVVLQFLNDSHRIASVTQAAWYVDSRGSYSWDVRKDINSLHMCAWFGLHTVIPKLLKQESDLSVDDSDTTYRQTALMYACRRGQVRTVSLLLELGASVNESSARGSTAAFEAVVWNRAKCLKLLLGSNKVNVNAAHGQMFRQTALMMAAEWGHEETLKELLQQSGIQVNQQDLEGKTALYHAVVMGHTEIVALLLDHKDINPNLVTRNGDSALSLAAQHGDVKIIDQLLQKNADPFIMDQFGGTAILRAADAGNLDAIKVMIAKNIDIRSLDKRGRSLLHGASLNGRKEVVEFLLSKGLSPNAQDENGRTPLHEASRAGQFSVVKFLLQMKIAADSLIKDKQGLTPHKLAWLHGHVSVMEVLEDQSFVPDPKLEGQKDISNEAELPIWAAAELGRKEVVQRSIAKGSNLEDTDPDGGNTALHCAVDHGHLEILQLLLDAKMSPSPINDIGRTPLHIAATRGDVHAAIHLLKHTAKPDVPDQWGYTPLQICQMGGFNAIDRVPVAIELIEAGAAIDAERMLMQPMFFKAVLEGRAKAVERLISAGADTLAKTRDGKTALQMAKDEAAKGTASAEKYGEVMRVLRKHKSFFIPSGYPSLADQDATTSLISEPKMGKAAFRPRPKNGPANLIAEATEETMR
ncbi:hypothetical protein MMC17_004149 [Xylographa soralifera]|nr:hypothetical protein [Xylographa soralifera]